MSNSKQFIIVRKLNSTTQPNGDIVSDEYSISDIKSSLGSDLSFPKEEFVTVDNGNIYVVLTCKHKETRKPNPDLGRGLKTYLE